MTELSAKTPRREPVINAALVIVMATFFVVEVLLVWHRIRSGHFGDFRHFYYAGRAMLEGTDPYTSGTGGYIYPPLIAMLFMPVAKLQYDTAARVSVAINAALSLAGLLVLTRAGVERLTNLRPAWRLIAVVAVVGTLFNFDKIRGELQMFQTNALMFLLFALALYWLDRRPWLAGVPLGVILNIKYLSIGLLPWLLLRRRWKSAAGCVGSAIAFALLPAVVTGWSANLHNLGVAYGGLGHMLGIGSGEQAHVENITDLLSCSITSALARATRYGPTLPKMLLAAAAVAAASFGVTALLYRRNHVPLFRWPAFAAQNLQPFRAMIGIEFVSVVMATLCFSPQTNSRHLFLALLLTVTGAVLLLHGRRRFDRLLMAVAMLLMLMAFTLPPGNRVEGRPARAAIEWFAIGGPCWGLLAATLTLVFVGLLQARRLTADSPDGGGP